MGNVVSPESVAVGASDLISREIAAARADLRPVSRRSLALVLVAQKHLPFREAMDVVDGWCDEHAPAIPGYVGSEFGIYWLKFLAVAFVIVGLGVAWQGVRMVQTGKAGWPWWAGATVFVGIAAFVWVQSIERELKK
ncbi:hypothetical protein EON81_14085 [bacterium]|nr:MAG: hypothetical protein EON81_14085 [bacterium]